MKHFHRFLLVSIVTLIPALGFAQPSIEFDNQSYDYGISYPNQKLVHEFHYKNIGTAPLIIEKVGKSCSCTAAVISATTTMPGQAGIISVTLSTGSPGKLRRTATVYSNDPKKPKVVLNVATEIKNLWSWSPRPNFTFREVPIHQSKTLELTLHSVEEKPFKILGYKVTKPEFTVEVGEYSDSSVPIKVTVTASDKKGILSDKLEIRTDHPKQPVLDVALYADVVGNVTFNKKRLYFGNVKAGETASRIITAKYMVKGGTKLKIIDIKSDVEGVSGKIKQVNPDGSVEIELSFTAPKQSGYKSGFINLKTNIESEPVAELPFSALVRR